MTKTKRGSIKGKRRNDSIPDPADGAEFDALSDSDKEKLYQYFDTHPNIKGRRLSKAEQKVIDAQVDAEFKKIGRPVVGEGCRVIAVSVEAGLLREADAYAKAHGLKRTQLIAQGLRAIMGKPRKSA